jgi:sulfofructose kinase
MRLSVPPPATTAHDVVGFGLNAVDHLCRVPRFPTFDSKLRLSGYDCRPGGQVATALVALTRWGCRTAYLGSFGDDALGAQAREALVRAGVSVEGAFTRAGVRNQLAVILIDAASGERTVLWHRDAALAVRPEELDRRRILAGRILYLDGYDREAATAAAGWARAAGIPTVLDLDAAGEGALDLLERVDVAFLSRACAAEIAGSQDPAAVLPILARCGCVLSGVTLGRDGALAHHAGTTVHAPGFPVHAVDTTGAGDVFHAAIAYGLLQGWETGAMLRFANAAAALQCTGLGAQAAVPTLDRVERFLAERS